METRKRLFHKDPNQSHAAQALFARTLAEQLPCLHSNDCLVSCSPCRTTTDSCLSIATAVSPSPSYYPSRVTCLNSWPLVHGLFNSKNGVAILNMISMECFSCITSKSPYVAGGSIRDISKGTTRRQILSIFRLVVLCFFQDINLTLFGFSFFAGLKTQASRHEATVINICPN